MQSQKENFFIIKSELEKLNKKKNKCACVCIRTYTYTHMYLSSIDREQSTGL